MVSSKEVRNSSDLIEYKRFVVIILNPEFRVYNCLPFTNHLKFMTHYSHPRQRYVYRKYFNGLQFSHYHFMKFGYKIIKVRTLYI